MQYESQSRDEVMHRAREVYMQALRTHQHALEVATLCALQRVRRSARERMSMPAAAQRPPESLLGGSQSVQGVASQRQNGPTPRQDGLRPRQDGPTPRLDGLAPRQDGLRPRQDGPTPRLDGLRPERDGHTPEEDVLTPRQAEVARLIARGLTNMQIAEELVVTKGTAANHVAAILGRLGVTNRAQVAAWVASREARTH